MINWGSMWDNHQELTVQERNVGVDKKPWQGSNSYSHWSHCQQSNRYTYIFFLKDGCSTQSYSWCRFPTKQH